MKPFRSLRVLWLLLSLCLLPATFAETVKDRDTAVRQDRARMENDPRWLYNDFKRGFAESKRMAKLLVVLRCVPYLSCAGIDAQVLKQAELELASLLDQFVSVRVINASALDLSLFQFDHNLYCSTLAKNPCPLFSSRAL